MRLGEVWRSRPEASCSRGLSRENRREVLWWFGRCRRRWIWSPIPPAAATPAAAAPAGPSPPRPSSPASHPPTRGEEGDYKSKNWFFLLFPTPSLPGDGSAAGERGQGGVRGFGGQAAENSQVLGGEAPTGSAA